MKLSSAFLLSAAFFLVGQVSAQTVPTDTVIPRGYTVGPGDEVTTKVIGEPNYDFVATVSEDGKIEVPFADKAISAQCKTEPELRAEVTALLAKYLRDPAINLRVTQRKSRPPVSVFGEVQHPQQIELSRRAHLLEALAFVGGVTEKSGGMVQIFRTSPPLCGQRDPDANWTVGVDGALDVPSRMYSLSSAKQGRDEANPEIFPGDIIVVQKSSPVYVMGEVIRPGELSIPEGGLPLMQAVAMANGMTREAKTRTIKVYRRKAGTPTPEVVSVDYDLIRKGTQKDVMLQPYDIVEVGKAGKTFLGYLTDFVIGVPNRIPLRTL